MISDFRDFRFIILARNFRFYDWFVLSTSSGTFFTGSFFVFSSALISISLGIVFFTWSTSGFSLQFFRRIVFAVISIGLLGFLCLFLGLSIILIIVFIFISMGFWDRFKRFKGNFRTTLLTSSLCRFLFLARVIGIFV